MAKVFISIPMKDRRHEDIINDQHKALEEACKVLNEPCEMIESCKVEYTKLKPLECLAESLKLLANADIAVFAKGWESARGCKIEHICAKEYGLKMIELN